LDPEAGGGKCRLNVGNYSIIHQNTYIFMKSTMRTSDITFLYSCLYTYSLHYQYEELCIIVSLTLKSPN